MLLCWITVKISENVIFFFQAEDGIRDYKVTGVQTCALPISSGSAHIPAYASKSSASHSLRMSRSVSNGVVSNPFIAATVRLILRVCCHNPAMKSSDPIQRSDSCSLGVRVFWLARFPGVVCGNSLHAGSIRYTG